MPFRFGGDAVHVYLTINKRLKTGPWTSGPFYSALAAQRKADLRRRGSRKPRRMDSDRLRAWVLDSLRRGWSPELIEGRLKARYAGDPSVLLQCLFDRFGSVFPQCGLMVFPGVVIVSR